MTDQPFDLSTATDEEIGANLTDYPVAMVEVTGGDGIAVGVPGKVWADEYVAFWMHEDGCVVSFPETDYDDRDHLQIAIPRERIGEVLQAIDAALAELDRRRAEGGE